MIGTDPIGIAACMADESRVGVPASFHLGRTRIIPTPIATRPEAET